MIETGREPDHAGRRASGPRVARYREIDEEHFLRDASNVIARIRPNDERHHVELLGRVLIAIVSELAGPRSPVTETAARAVLSNFVDAL